jgi:hypothetical protein
MSSVSIYAARVENNCGEAGIIYSYEEIAPQDGPQFRVLPGGFIHVDMPDGYEFELAHDASQESDIGGERMVFDPEATRLTDTGRMYMSAYRVIQRVESEVSDFTQRRSMAPPETVS